MGHRINVMLDGQVWEDFQQIPKGVRSQAVNASLAEWLARQKRQRLLQEMRRPQRPRTLKARNPWFCCGGSVIA